MADSVDVEYTACRADGTPIPAWHLAPGWRRVGAAAYRRDCVRTTDRWVVPVLVALVGVGAALLGRAGWRVYVVRGR